MLVPHDLPGRLSRDRLQFEGTPYDDEYCAHRARLVDFVPAQLASPSTSTPL